MALPNFDKIFIGDTDASKLGIDVVLIQENQPIEFFSKKLSDTRQRWSAYDQELYVVVKACQQWSHYLVQKQFILNYNNQAINYFKSQKTLNDKHTHWSTFLAKFHYIFNHKADTLNKVVDVLSRQSFVIWTLCNEIVAFNSLKVQYPSYSNFHEI